MPIVGGRCIDLWTLDHLESHGRDVCLIRISNATKCPSYGRAGSVCSLLYSFFRYQLMHGFETRCIGRLSRAERSGNMFTQQATNITLLHLRCVKHVHRDAQSDTDFANSNHRAVKFLAHHVRY